MSIKRIRPRERLPAASTRMLDRHARMQRHMAVTVVFPRKALPAPGPFARERSLLRVRAQVSPEVEPPRKRAPTSRHRTVELRLVPPSTGARSLRRGRRHMLFLDLHDRRETHARIVWAVWAHHHIRPAFGKRPVS